MSAKRNRWGQAVWGEAKDVNTSQALILQKIAAPQVQRGCVSEQLAKFQQLGDGDGSVGAQDERNLAHRRIEPLVNQSKIFEV